VSGRRALEKGPASPHTSHITATEPGRGRGGASGPSAGHRIIRPDGNEAGQGQDVARLHNQPPRVASGYERK